MCFGLEQTVLFTEFSSPPAGVMVVVRRVCIRITDMLLGTAVPAASPSRKETSPCGVASKRLALKTGPFFGHIMEEVKQRKQTVIL